MRKHNYLCTNPECSTKLIAILKEEDTAEKCPECTRKLKLVGYLSGTIPKGDRHFKRY